MEFCLFNFSYFTFCFDGFHLKKLKIIQLIFELAKNLVVNNKDNRTIGLIVALWKFDVLKISRFVLEASLLGQIFFLRISNLHGN